MWVNRPKFIARWSGSGLPQSQPQCNLPEGGRRRLAGIIPPLFGAWNPTDSDRTARPCAKHVRPRMRLGTGVLQDAGIAPLRVANRRDHGAGAGLSWEGCFGLDRLGGGLPEQAPGFCSARPWSRLGLGVWNSGGWAPGTGPAAGAGRATAGGCVPLPGQVPLSWNGACRAGAASGTTPKVVMASEDIIRMLGLDGGSPVATPWYTTQIQAALEDQYYPWDVKDALARLIGRRVLTDFGQDGVPELRSLEQISNMRFLADSRAVEDEAGRETTIRTIIKWGRLLDEYCSAENSRLRGEHLERLIVDLLEALGLQIEGMHTRKHGTYTSREGRSNLDIVARCPGSGLGLGMEVKNKLKVMDKEKITKKIRVCRQLGLVPVFASRWNAPYSGYISSYGGYNWMFLEQIVPPAQKDLAAKLLRMPPAEGIDGGGAPRLRLPLVVRDSLPADAAASFAQWIRWMDGVCRTSALGM